MYLSFSLSLSIYIYIYTYVYVYIYIYTYMVLEYDGQSCGHVSPPTRSFLVPSPHAGIG